MRRTLTALCLVSATCVAPASAQDPVAASAPRRPLVGLALGGGSALGIAHVGFLQWLDQHRIPVDLIGGTSMGGLVAGAFATGMSPSEVHELLDGIDWGQLFYSDVPFAEKSFRRKEDARLHPTTLEFGLRGGFRLPAALNSGQQVELLLASLTLPYYALADFDDLPTPFRTVAADLRSAAPVVFAGGSLADAMRATMAIPGAFAPVEIGQWILVDGGVLNNVPADVVRGMGAGVVIAVDVGGEARERKPATSLFGVLGETVDAVMRENTRRATAQADLLVRPDLKGLESMDWRKGEEIRARGYRAAEASAEALLRYAVDEAAYAEYLAERARRRKTVLPVPASIRVTGVASREQGGIARRLARHLGVPADPKRLAADMVALTGNEQYEKVTYRFLHEGGQPVLDVRVQPKPYGPPFLLVTPVMESISSTVFAAGLRARVTAFDVTGYLSELRLDGAVGTGLSAAAELYLPIRRSRWFIAPNGVAAETTENAYESGEAISQYGLTSTSVGISAGWTSGLRHEVRAGYEVGHLDASVRIGESTTPAVAGAERAARLRWVFDDQDSALVPSRGAYVRATLDRFMDAADPVFPADAPAGRDFDSRFTTAEVEVSVFRSLGTRQRFFARFDGGTSFGGHPIPPHDFTLGGPFRLGAYDRNEFRGANMLFASTGVLRQIARLPDFLGQGAFAGAWLEGGSVFDRVAEARVRVDLTAGLILETLFGPVSATASVGADGAFGLFVGMGRVLR